jgi:hypothetical protein
MWLISNWGFHTHFAAHPSAVLTGMLVVMELSPMMPVRIGAMIFDAKFAMCGNSNVLVWSSMLYRPGRS